MKLAILLQQHLVLYSLQIYLYGIVDGRKSYPQDSIQYKNEMCSQNCIRKFPSESLMGDQLQCINSCVSRFIAECNNADLKVWVVMNWLIILNSMLILQMLLLLGAVEGQSYDVGDNGKLQCKNGYEMGTRLKTMKHLGLKM